MVHKNEIRNQSIHRAPLAQRMLIGAAIAIIPISLLLVTGDPPNPEWSKFWMIQPLIIVPLAGAAGGVFYHLMDQFRIQGGWKKVLANVFSIIVFLVGVWMGIVLGLNGTYWD